MRQSDGSTYAVLFAHSAGVLQVARPRQTERSTFEVAIGEHVGQTEGIVVLLCVERNEK